jgi:DNA-binding response OmpR family regulator
MSAPEKPLEKPGRPRLLLAEDEPSLAKGLHYNFDKRGYEVTHFARGDDALRAGLTEGFDLIVLDVMMPGLSGFEVCERLRRESIHTPILMLTARSEVENRIKGLNLGADDYLGKPFNLEELMMRAAALLRRRQWNDLPNPPRSTIRIESVEFDTNRLELRGSRGQAALTAIEARLLQQLVTSRGQTLSRAVILRRVWGLHEDTQTRTLDNFIMRLRHHLEAVGGAADWIESVRGVGYRMSGTLAID